MFSLIVLLPLFGFFCGSLFGKFIGNKGVCFITTGFTFISFIFSFCIYWDILSTGNVYIISLIRWIYADTFSVNWAFCFDSLTATMIVVVTFISSLVHLYSTEYMEHDPHLPRFMSYLSLFTFFMLILVTANNFLQMFVGWEGVGVSSYLLINFWFTRIQANKAAIKAMLVNRVGDFALLLALFSIYFVFNSLDYDIVFSLVPLIISYKIIIGSFQLPIIDLICIFLFIGAMGKSAQFGLHTWLPDAMEGPTPVSALIHAATMVTAGIFLLTRCSYIFELSPFVLNFVVIVGSLTAFFAATTGLCQNDIKRVIAYSTCSQLGYMVFACGLSSYEVGMFHLSNHAFFKALLFLGAGSVIHALSDEQDMRKMGGVKNLLPFSYSIMVVGSLALIGFPFLAGFYSKDVILEISYASQTFSAHFSFILGILAAFSTAFYSTRLLFLVFLTNTNTNKIDIFNAHEGTWRMTLPLFILSLLSIFIGFLSKDIFIGFGTNFWGSSIFILPDHYMLGDIEFIELHWKLLPLLVTLMGVFIAYFLYSFQLQEYFLFKKTFQFKVFYTFLNKKWYFDKFYNEMINQNALISGYDFFYKSVDRGILEKFGPFGIGQFIQESSSYLSRYQTGFILDYLSFILISLICCIFFTLKQTIFVIFSIWIYFSFFDDLK